MGSDSDLATMRAAAETLQSLGVNCEVTIVSAHRTPDRMMRYARDAHARGLKVDFSFFSLFSRCGYISPSNQASSRPIINKSM